MEFSLSQIFSELERLLSSSSLPSARWLADITITPGEPLENLPPQVRIPFGWTACAIAADHPVGLRWSKNSFSYQPSTSERAKAVLRISVALDVREIKTVEVRLAISQRLIGFFDVRYAHVLQPFELVIPSDLLDALLEEGCELRLVEGTAPLWIFIDPADSSSNFAGSAGMSAKTNNNGYLPHLIFILENTSASEETVVLKQALLNLSSLSSVQQWGWMEGAVLDGLYDLSRCNIATEELPSQYFSSRCQRTLAEHLALFIQTEGLTYENPRSQPRDGQIYGIEGTLPFAVLAKLKPDDPNLNLAKDFWLSQTNEEEDDDDDDVIMDEAMVSAEGSYTVAYPLAVIARQLQSRNLAQLALVQLLERKRRLSDVENSTVYLRRYLDQRRTFPNWGRAWAWYLLGLVRTLGELQATDLGLQADDLAELRGECERAVQQISTWQLPNGLWRCFVDDATTEIDTSASAGIAAAIALAVNYKLIGEAYRQVSVQALCGLIRYITADGYLRGVAQSNKAGEELQRSDYRVISPMALGLLGQLVAALAV
jgi:unsaturated rhamnogalacturonyl hydrolase